MGTGLFAPMCQSVQISKPERTLDDDVPNIWQFTVIATNAIGSFQDEQGHVPCAVSPVASRGTRPGRRCLQGAVVKHRIYGTAKFEMNLMETNASA